MLSLMSEITDIADWHRSVFEQNFVDSWKSTALSQDGITQRMVDWVSQGSDTVLVWKVANGLCSVSVRCSSMQMNSGRPISSLRWIEVFSSQTIS